MKVVDHNGRVRSWNKALDLLRCLGGFACGLGLSVLWPLKGTETFQRLVANRKGIALGICLGSVYWALWTYRYSEVYHGYPETGPGVDYRIIWHQVNGSYDEWARSAWWYSMTTTGPYGWLYKDGTKPALYWAAFGYLPLPLATKCWIGLLVACYVIILLRLMETHYGWIIALVTLKPFLVEIQAGNIAPLLALMATTPLGVVLGTCVKSYVAGFVVVLAVRGIVEARSHEEIDSA